MTSSERHALAELIQYDFEAGAWLWRKQVVPHVNLDRSKNASSLFHTGQVWYANGCGLWFAMRGEAAWINKALIHLSQSGLGGKRSTGHGAFEWAGSPDDLAPATEQWGMCLSRCAPLPDELSALQDSRAAYKLVTVGGWCQDAERHPWRRRSVRMLAEGAILPAKLRGQLIDVRPEHVENWRGEMHKYIAAAWPS